MRIVLALAINARGMYIINYSSIRFTAWYAELNPFQFRIRTFDTDTGTIAQSSLILGLMYLILMKFW
jgi:hypothetical protein